MLKLSLIKSILLMWCIAMTGCLSEWPSHLENFEQRRLNTSDLISQIDAIDFIYINGGEFTMGSDEGPSSEQPAHQVSVPSFEMTRTEITVAQYKACVDLGPCQVPENPPYGYLFFSSDCNWDHSDRQTHPINCLTWSQARTFAQWIGADLPSEAQWEFAAKGGMNNTFKYAGSNDLDPIAWFAENTYTSQPVGLKNPNGYGLHDLSGNVSEWVLDEIRPYASTPTDGSPYCTCFDCSFGCGTTKDRVYRGGSWEGSTTITARPNGRAYQGLHTIGLRCVKNIND